MQQTKACLLLTIHRQVTEFNRVSSLSCNNSVRYSDASRESAIFSFHVQYVHMSAKRRCKFYFKCQTNKAGSLPEASKTCFSDKSYLKGKEERDF
jgi:hypothetical protein